MARRCQRPSVVTLASAQDRAEVEALAADQDPTGECVGLAWVDQGYTSDGPATVAGLDVLAFAGLLLPRLVTLLAGSPRQT